MSELRPLTQHEEETGRMDADPKGVEALKEALRVSREMGMDPHEDAPYNPTPEDEAAATNGVPKVQAELDRIKQPTPAQRQARKDRRQNR